MNILDIANGALVEQVDTEIQRVLANIIDPNTSSVAKRKITITLEFRPQEERDLSDVNFTTKSILAPARAITTRVAFERDNKGKVIAEELGRNQLKGQASIDYETGEIKEPKTLSRVVNLK